MKYGNKGATPSWGWLEKGVGGPFKSHLCDTRHDVVMITIKLYAIQDGSAILFWFNAFVS